MQHVKLWFKILVAFTLPFVRLWFKILIGFSLPLGKFWFKILTVFTLTFGRFWFKILIRFPLPLGKLWFKILIAFTLSFWKILIQNIDRVYLTFWKTYFSVDDWIAYINQSHYPPWVVIMSSVCTVGVYYGGECHLTKYCRKTGTIDIDSMDCDTKEIILWRSGLSIFGDNWQSLATIVI